MDIEKGTRWLPFKEADKSSIVFGTLLAIGSLLLLRDMPREILLLITPQFSFFITGLSLIVRAFRAGMSGRPILCILFGTPLIFFSVMLIAASRNDKGLTGILLGVLALALSIFLLQYGWKTVKPEDKQEDEQENE